jgi:flagellar biosynthetic protein FlhB
MESSSQDRDLPASQQKLDKARKDGQVARSRDLGHLAVLGTGALSLIALGPAMLDKLQLHLSRQLMFNASALVKPESMLVRLQDMVAAGLMGCVVFAVITMAVSTLSTVTTGGWVVSMKPITPDLSRLNPLTGLSQMFNKDKFTEVLKMIFITIALFIVGTFFLNAGIATLSTLILQPSSSSLVLLADWIKDGMSLLLVVILLVAMVDVPLQVFLHKSKLKMSHQEVKEEGKEANGNPLIKNKLRQRQREISQGASVGAVPKADFVLMNPTHFAVAIKYDEKTMHAPQVVSKGADLLAFKIRDIAKNNSIPVIQSPMLARALYTHAEIDQDIPASLYTAVAQVLAYIYRLKAALRGDSPMPGEPPQPFVPPELDPLSKIVANTRISTP